MFDVVNVSGLIGGTPVCNASTPDSAIGVDCLYFDDCGNITFALGNSFCNVSNTTVPSRAPPKHSTTAVTNGVRVVTAYYASTVEVTFQLPTLRFNPTSAVTYKFYNFDFSKIDHPTFDKYCTGTTFDKDGVFAGDMAKLFQVDPLDLTVQSHSFSSDGGSIKVQIKVFADFEDGVADRAYYSLEYPNCVLGQWEAWGDCTDVCGDGDQYRYRNVSMPGFSPKSIPAAATATGYGKKCDPTRSDKQSCAGNYDFDCQLGGWAPWGPCSVACDNSKGHSAGSQSRSRNVIRARACAGRACNSTFESQPCNARYNCSTAALVGINVTKQGRFRLRCRRSFALGCRRNPVCRSTRCRCGRNHQRPQHQHQRHYHRHGGSPAAAARAALLPMARKARASQQPALLTRRTRNASSRSQALLQLQRHCGKWRMAMTSSN